MAVLGAVGDIVVRSRIYADGEAIDRDYQETLSYLRESDLVWGACEVQFASRGYRSDAPIAYLVDPAVAGDLGRAGFGLLTVATNHTCDFGPDAFLETIRHLNEAGVSTVGGGVSLDASFEPDIREMGDCRIGTLAVSCLLPPDYAATETRPGIAPLAIEQWPEIHPILLATEPGAPMRMRSKVSAGHLDRLRDAIANLRPHVDVLIVSVHWGYGRGDPLAEYQRPLGHALIDAGADMVLGNHAHSPAGLETYQGKPILYSLGNHIAQQDWDNATPDQQVIFSQIDPWSLVSRIHIDSGGISAIEFRATECNKAGFPALLKEPSRALPIFERFLRLAASENTKFEISGASLMASFG
ncbi:CapA family protein [Bosea sp. RAF48]|uniref:CapA family protein n=1 Tax=Bosea sp. RAF48 TaxID=3237480 RepID=UPI003F8F96B1